MNISASPQSLDSDLALRLSRQQQDALEELVQRFAPQVTRQARRLLGWSTDIDDVVQDVFVMAMRSAGGFRRDASLSTWLTVITLNRCRTLQRRLQVRRQVQALLSHGPWPHAQPADHQAVSDETAATVRAAVAKLPHRDREVIVLLYLEQKSLDELTELLGVTRNAVEVRLHRARTRLRESLKGCGLGFDHES